MGGFKFEMWGEIASLEPKGRDELVGSLPTHPLEGAKRGGKRQKPSPYRGGDSRPALYDVPPSSWKKRRKALKKRRGSTRTWKKRKQRKGRKRE